MASTNRYIPTIETLTNITPVTIIRRRRVAVSVTAILAARRVMYQRAPRTYIPRPVFCFESHITGLSDKFFTRLYRMSKPCFFELAKLVAIQRAQSGRSFQKSSPLLRHSVTLRWLAGGSYLDVSQAHRISVDSFYFYVTETLQDIDKSLKLQFPYSNEDWLARSSSGFSRTGRSPLHSCVAALDGIAIRIQEPSMTEVGNTSTYYNRKGFFAINVQAMCDSDYRFVFVSAKAAGSTHDSTAFGMSGQCKLLSKTTDGLLKPYWIACDEAYCATHNMLTPWPGKCLPVHKDCFNYWLSSARIFIEQAFGILVARWGIFWRVLRVKVSKAAHIVSVCCKLHNFIIDQTGRSVVPIPSGIDNERHIETTRCDVDLQDECDREYDLHCRRRDLEACNPREYFTECIEDEGLKRPLVY